MQILGLDPVSHLLRGSVHIQLHEPIACLSAHPVICLMLCPDPRQRLAPERDLGRSQVRSQRDRASSVDGKAFELLLIPELFG